MGNLQNGPSLDQNPGIVFRRRRAWREI